MDRGRLGHAILVLALLALVDLVRAAHIAPAATNSTPRAGSAASGPPDPSLFALLIAQCARPGQLPPSPHGDHPPPQAMPRTDEGIVADCVDGLRRPLDTGRRQSVYGPEFVRIVLNGAGLERIKTRPSGGGTVFGGYLGSYCIHGEHTPARTVVSAVGPGAKGSCPA
jgi:hypothetical protein